MKKQLLFLSAIFAMSILLFTGCKKEGAPGKDGKDGNANVVHHTFSVNSWSSNSSRYFTYLPVGELTADNINSASIEVYFSTTPNTWIALPYTYVSTPNNYFMGFLTEVGDVEIRWDCNSTISIGSDPNTIFGTTVQIKIVVIPPAMRKPNVNHHNYSDVKAAYNLRD